MAKKVLMQYRSVFFDLDHTLWDYETNSRETLQELYDENSLQAAGVPAFEGFHQAFREVNTALWELYDTGKIDSTVIRNERFARILSRFEVVNDSLAQQLSFEYLNRCPAKGHLMPHAREVLTYLAERYSLTVITNGFEETQQVKISASGIQSFFDHVITSQRAGHKKPAREIFEFALNLNGVAPHEAMMVGDNLITDVAGARNASIDCAFFNPDKVPHQENMKFEIHSLNELHSLL